MVVQAGFVRLYLVVQIGFVRPYMVVQIGFVRPQAVVQIGFVQPRTVVQNVFFSANTTIFFYITARWRSAAREDQTKVERGGRERERRDEVWQIWLHAGRTGEDWSGCDGGEQEE